MLSNPYIEFLLLWMLFWEHQEEFEKVRDPARGKSCENENLFMVSEDYWFESHPGYSSKILITLI